MLTLKDFLLIAIIGGLLLSPFYYLEYIKPKERKIDYNYQGKIWWIYGGTKAHEIYRFRKEERLYIKMRYENNNGRWIEESFAAGEFSIRKTDQFKSEKEH